MLASPLLVVWFWTLWSSVPAVAGSLLRRGLSTGTGENPWDHPTLAATRSLRSSVPQCFFINLPHRQDRLRSIEAQLQQVDLTCSRVEASDAHLLAINPQEACRRSHMSALSALEASGAPYGLILEDDATWTVSTDRVVSTLQHVAEDIKKHPVILLACNGGMGYATDKSWLWTVYNCQTTSGYFIRRDYIPKLKQAWGSEVTSYWGAIDQIWKPLQMSDDWAITVPKLIIQGASYSDIEGRYVDYGVLQRQRALRRSNVSLNGSIAANTNPINASLNGSIPMMQPTAA